jgi:sortase A
MGRRRSAPSQKTGITSEINLNRGAAHIDGTAALSDSGNIGIAGHRDGFFRKLQDITIDGQVELVVRQRTMRTSARPT